MGRLKRTYRIQVVTADPEGILSKLWNENIDIFDFKITELLTVEFSVYSKQLDQLQTILRKHGSKLSIIGKEGYFWKFLEFRWRPVLLLGIVLYLFATLFLPNRIYFLKVTGNETVPSNYILSAAQACGIKFGAKASLVRSEDIKNLLLSQLPELQWIGVTTSRSVATIHVKERSNVENKTGDVYMVSDIVAGMDGIITQVTTLKGTPLVQPGQAVEKGEILISGYTDCERYIKAEQAEGEVYAHSNRQITAVSLCPKEFRDNIFRKHACFKLRIGKKVINLCNHSGIQDTTCVKMYTEDYWTLPGNFRLPIALLKEEHIFYDISVAVDEQTYEWMSDHTQEYLLSHMVAGQILEESLEWGVYEDYCVLFGNYACHEMIGRVKHEELIEQYAEDN